ncbi:23S rRNA m(5)U-747 methyltransferase [Brevibacterium iodinum ATCC 49514]|uniref:23S rRNA m(5)U-747 methyltransferase n=1 Tax=Brevibacterium iodinum ATCC 49514 TaxID=1255616 RepID=A0A2H1J4G8_9MICO|nr:methyltransferase domain-containing protein [Brevibacterium iodinum]SMX82356.1 23S rRNA m(5)U-747 methyltransferase [Brevibacterium iodinum ATCC 49514]SUW14335.1 23S rRNA (uracil(747)-C(5))-methyltransferase RlmC [Brevibacterium iodinum]
MTTLPLTPASADHGRLHCGYFERGECRSCALIETPYGQQITDKESWCRETLAEAAPRIWLPTFAGGARDFRNRAKLAVGGPARHVTLGILDQEFHGVDLRDCGIQAPAIRAVIPVLADFLDGTGLEPYDVSARRGELKFVHVTAAPSGELMIRFVVRTQHGLDVLRSRKESFFELVPDASVVSVNLLPEHKAVLEGSREEMLRGESLRMNLDRVDLHLRPQSFFQTNTAVAVGLYNQVSEWVDAVEASNLWDLYCGVGGFALYCAGPSRRGTGVEVSEQAIESAKVSAAELGIDARFLVGDATEFAEENLAASTGVERPDCVIVNPPRRGIGARLSAALENSGVEHIVYSSCNPVSLAKDLARMPAYEVAQARIFDMFPHTKHLEVAVLLQRR